MDALPPTDAMAAPPVNNARNRRGRPFAPGQGGRPKGARNKRSLLVETLMADDTEAITKVVITKAKKGDLTACKIVLDRIAPPRKGRPISIRLPAITDAGSTLAAHTEVMRAVASGRLSLDEGEALCGMLAGRIKLIEVVDHADRIRALEKQVGVRK
jgi:hypothetical protein